MVAEQSDLVACLALATIGDKEKDTFCHAKGDTKIQLEAKCLRACFLVCVRSFRVLDANVIPSRLGITAGERQCARQKQM